MGIAGYRQPFYPALTAITTGERPAGTRYGHRVHICMTISIGHVITGMQRVYLPGETTTGCKEVMEITRNVIMHRPNVSITGNKVTLHKTTVSAWTTGRKAGIVGRLNKIPVSKAVTVSQPDPITDKTADKAATANLRNKTGVVTASRQTKTAAAIMAIQAVASTTPKTVRKADILPAE